jgi:hypothetical protein
VLTLYHLPFATLTQVHMLHIAQTAIIACMKASSDFAAEPSNMSPLCRLQLGEAGMQALISLGNGDMRRTLNIFQVLFDSSARLLKQHSTTGVMMLASCCGRNHLVCKYAHM